MRRFVIIMLLASLAVGGVISYFASRSPDGLESVAEDIGFAGKSDESALKIFPDYTIPGLNGFFSNGIAGAVGVAAVFGLVWILGKAIAHKKN